jgi:Transposase
VPRVHLPSQGVCRTSSGTGPADAARISDRLLQELQALGLSASAEVSERLAPRLGMQVKAPTLLRYLRTIPAPSEVPVRVLGLDDFAIRRGDRYGTILVNLETGKPLDLLPDRTAEAVFPWLEKHQEINVVSRDRASAYADAVKRALPHATQVADRYHLIQNLREHLQRFLDRKRTWLPEVEDIPLKAGSTSGQGLGGSLNNQSGTVTSTGSQAERTDQSEAQVEPELPPALVDQAIELASLTYAERKKKISRDKRYARYEQSADSAPSGHEWACYCPGVADESAHHSAISFLRRLPGTCSWFWTTSMWQEQARPLSLVSAGTLERG